MTEQELVNAVLTELQKNKKDVSTATIIDALKGGEYVVCYDSEGRLSRISPNNLSESKTMYLTEEEYENLVLNGLVQDDVEYNIYEE
jgi:hypothetical protein